jgi:putative nucleotidyltransferase with HDIG domain
MPEIPTVRKLTRKEILNLLYFVLSIIIVVAMWPYNSAFSWPFLLGVVIIVSACYLTLYLFLAHFRTEVMMVTRKTLFIILTILSFIMLTRLVTEYTGQKLIFLIPFVVIPVVIRTFYDARLALFCLLIPVMLAGFMIQAPFTFIFMSFISGMVAIYTLSNIYRKGKLFLTALLVIVSYSVLYVGLSLIKDGSLSNIRSSDFVLFAGNGLLVLTGYPVIFLFEKKFLFLSDNTLLELADTNQPLLRKLAVEAPGTFQHSLQVANLAEEAARITGGNLLLVRAGSMYHDIGKIANPDYYIENQIEGYSPHDDLDPAESARAIINHVRNGVTLARNFKIPVQIIDFIRTHHGTTVAYYFFKKYTDLNPWDTSRENEFTYPGPKPFSRETAVVMMADAVEAASRSLKKYTEESISELVERIVLQQEKDEQFSDTPLTFKDISEIKTAFRKRLLNIYHIRVEYPEREY